MNVFQKIFWSKSEGVVVIIVYLKSQITVKKDYCQHAQIVKCHVHLDYHLQLVFLDQILDVNISSNLNKAKDKESDQRTLISLMLLAFQN